LEQSFGVTTIETYSSSWRQVDIAFLGLMAVQAGDAVLAVLAVIPLPVEAGVLGHMAVDAFLPLGIAPVDAGLAGGADRMGIGGDQQADSAKEPGPDDACAWAGAKIRPQRSSGHGALLDRS